MRTASKCRGELEDRKVEGKNDGQGRIYAEDAERGVPRFMQVMSVEGVTACTNTPAILDRLAPANNLPKPRVRGVQA
jgi:hypothetical protein